MHTVFWGGEPIHDRESTEGRKRGKRNVEN
jgi:hypothetical protein